MKGKSAARHAFVHGPTDNLPAEQVDDDRQIPAAVRRPDCQGCIGFDMRRSPETAILLTMSRENKVNDIIL